MPFHRRLDFLKNGVVYGVGMVFGDVAKDLQARQTVNSVTF